MKPEYSVPYEPMLVQRGYKKVFDKVFMYLDGVTPAHGEQGEQQTGEVVTDVSKADSNTCITAGRFPNHQLRNGVTIQHYYGQLKLPATQNLQHM